MLARPDSPVSRPGKVINSRRAVWQGMLSLLDGTNTATVAGTRYWSSIEIPEEMALTGISYLVGLTGLVSGDKVIVELHGGSGELIATSALAGTAVAAASTIDKIPFISPVVVMSPGLYFLVLQFNTSVTTYRSLSAGSTAEQTVITGTSAGTFGTSAAIAPGSTFTAGVGPIAFTY